MGRSFDSEEHESKDDIVSRAFRKYDELLNLKSEGSGTSDVNLENLNAKLREKYAFILSRNLSKGLVHGDLKLENLLFLSDGSLSAVLDFDDYRYSYLIEEAVMTLMHNLHSSAENIIRSGNYDSFVSGIDNPILLHEFENLKFFLQARFLYEVCKYMINDKANLVGELWQDANIRKFALGGL